MEAQAKTEKKAKKEIDASGGNEYIGAIRENVNKSEEVDASGLDSAIAALDVGACLLRGGERRGRGGERRGSGGWRGWGTLPVGARTHATERERTAPGGRCN